MKTEQSPKTPENEIFSKPKVTKTNLKKKEYDTI